ncbi:cyclic nucleotide-binding domain-containing protein [Balneolaceae bacterium ANBcel3]|nr:cyclic nucleotide-binding domain-containing protein [Balneolaceae bacterium ANBcel3]
MLPTKFWNRIKSHTELIYQSPFLKRLSQLERYELLQLSHRRRYKAGEFVYHQGDPGTGIYFIEQGSVELSFQKSPDVETVVLTDLHAPESFGAFSVDYQIRRKATARCITDCILFGFFISDYQTLSKRHPRIALRFLETLNVTTIQQLDHAVSKKSSEDDELEASALLFETYELPAEKAVNNKIR